MGSDREEEAQLQGQREATGLLSASTNVAHPSAIAEEGETDACHSSSTSAESLDAEVGTNTPLVNEDTSLEEDSASRNLSSEKVRQNPAPLESRSHLPNASEGSLSEPNEEEEKPATADLDVQLQEEEEAAEAGTIGQVQPEGPEPVRYSEAGEPPALQPDTQVTTEPQQLADLVIQVNEEQEQASTVDQALTVGQTATIDHAPVDETVTIDRASTVDQTVTIDHASTVDQTVRVHQEDDNNHDYEEEEEEEEEAAAATEEEAATGGQVQPEGPEPVGYSEVGEPTAPHIDTTKAEIETRLLSPSPPTVPLPIASIEGQDSGGWTCSVPSQNSGSAAVSTNNAAFYYGPSEPPEGTKDRAAQHEITQPASKGKQVQIPPPPDFINCDPASTEEMELPLVDEQAETIQTAAVRPKREAFRIMGPSTEVVLFGVGIGDDYLVESDQLPDEHETEERLLDVAKLKPGIVWDRRFRVIQRLGSGGMATVYKATQIQMSVTVALKIMHHDMNVSSGTARFMREARLLSAINHPNIVRLQAYGSTKHQVHFMALEFINGRPLSQILAEETIEPPRAVLITQQICRGLQAAHEAGIIHRDLKPSNIIIALDDKDDEIVKIIDFGIARLAEDLDDTCGQVTRTNAVLGTPLYMSPEQCMAKKPDFRCDIYSVGCLLYEMLCGKPPFTSDQPYVVLAAHINDPVKSLPVRVPVPNALENIVLRCLQKKPTARYSSAAELAEELADINWDTISITQIKPGEKSRLEKFNWVYFTVIVICLTGIAAIGLNIHNAQSIAEMLNGHSSRLLGRALEPRGTTLERMPDAAVRIDYYRRWIKEKSSTTKPNGDAHFYLAEDLFTIVGMSEDCRHEYEMAIEIYRRQLSMQATEQAPDLNSVAHAAENLSKCISVVESPIEARKNLEQQVEKWKSKLNPDQLVLLYMQASRLSTSGLDFKKAEEYAALAVDVLKDSRDPVPICSAKLMHVQTLFNVNRRDAAMLLLAKTDQERCSVKPNESLADWNRTVGYQYLLMGDYDEAIEKLNQSLNDKTSFKLETYELKAVVYEMMDRWTDARDTLIEAIKDSEKLQAHQRWRILVDLALIRTSKRADVDLSEATDILFKSNKDNVVDNAVLDMMILAAHHVMMASDNVDAVRILERAESLFRKSTLDKKKFGEFESVHAANLLFEMITAGKFEATSELARNLYDPKAELHVEPGLRLQCLHAVADSFIYKNDPNKSVETKADIVGRIKAVDVFLAEKAPGSLFQLEAFLDRAIVQRNLRLGYEQWLNWSQDLITQHKTLFNTSLPIVTTRIYQALSNRDNLLADKLFEMGLAVYGESNYKLTYMIDSGNQYFAAGRYDRAIDIWLPVVDSKDIATVDEPVVRSLFNHLIFAAEKTCHKRLAELKQKVPAQHH